jgi:sugar transferase (PEP-CTERM/EpsH1 system associated)
VRPGPVPPVRPELTASVRPEPVEGRVPGTHTTSAPSGPTITPVRPESTTSVRPEPVEGRASTRTTPAPLIAHIVHRFDVGGLENGVVNLINHMPSGHYHHAIIALTEASESFRARLHDPEIAVLALHKREGHDLGLHLRLWRALRQLRPAIVHTRNLATLESQLPAWLAGVRARVHGEHGWDIGDLDGSRGRYRTLRRAFRPLVGRYIALSSHQVAYLQDQVGVIEERLSHIYNGVDTERFHPANRDADAAGRVHQREPLPIAGFAGPGDVVIGTVLRMQPVKDPLNLAQAFVELCAQVEEPERLRLVMIGDGPLRAEALALLEQAGLADQSWLPGAREDIPDLLRGLDLFVLPSQAEGICNTILEAMATGLPVVATDVGGNPDLVQPGITGSLVPASNPVALAKTLATYVTDPDRRRREGGMARARAEKHFSMDAMVHGYMNVYARALEGAA